MRMVPVAGACAAAGLVIAGLTMTGLSGKFAHLVYMVTGANVFPTLLLAAAITILLGMGMPTPSAYILAAVLMGPLLAPMHIGMLPGHMFLLYFAVMSALTPPVAVAAYAASSIAEDNPLAHRRPRGQVRARRAGGAVHLRLWPRTAVAGAALAKRDHLRDRRGGPDPARHGDRGVRAGLRRMVEPRS